MKTALRICLALVGLLWLSPNGLPAQGHFYVQISDRSISMDEELEVRFILEDPQGRVSDFRPPRFEGFRVVSGPSRISNVQIINGQKKEERAFAYLIKPLKTGNLTIGHATIKVGKITLRTQTVSVEVKESTSSALPQANGDAPYFLRREARPVEAYTGQQISLDLKLYDRDEVDVQSYNLLREAQFPGFFTTTLRTYHKGAQEISIGDVPYTVFTLRRTAVFAQKAGEYRIEPVEVRIQVLDPTQRRRQNFFFRPRSKSIDLQSDSLFLHIKPLPAPLPLHFSGGVGHYSFEVQTDKTQLTTDEICYLQVRITGNGDPKRFHFPLPEFSDSLEVYEPKVLDSREYENGGQLWHTQTLEYAILPKYPGNYTLRPKLVYFDTDSLRYLTLQSRKIRLHVRQGSRIATSESDKPSAESQLPPLLSISRFSQLADTPLLITQSRYISLLLLPFLLLAIGIVYERLRGEGPDAAERARLRALAFAERQIKEAGALLEKGNTRSFYESLYRAMQAYLHRKLGLPASALSASRLGEALQGQLEGLPAEEWVQLFQQTEQALFAGRQTDSSTMRQDYARAKELIAKTEKALSIAHTKPPASRG